MHYYSNAYSNRAGFAGLTVRVRSVLSLCAKEAALTYLLTSGQANPALL